MVVNTTSANVFEIEDVAIKIAQDTSANSYILHRTEVCTRSVHNQACSIVCLGTVSSKSNVLHKSKGGYCHNL